MTKMNWDRVRREGRLRNHTGGFGDYEALDPPPSLLANVKNRAVRALPPTRAGTPNQKDTLYVRVVAHRRQTGIVAEPDFDAGMVWDLVVERPPRRQAAAAKRHADKLGLEPDDILDLSSYGALAEGFDWIGDLLGVDARWLQTWLYEMPERAIERECLLRPETDRVSNFGAAAAVRGQCADYLRLNGGQLVNMLELAIAYDQTYCMWAGDDFGVSAARLCDAVEDVRRERFLAEAQAELQLKVWWDTLAAQLEATC